MSWPIPPGTHQRQEPKGRRSQPSLCCCTTPGGWQEVVLDDYFDNDDNNYDDDDDENVPLAKKLYVWAPCMPYSANG